MVTVAESEETSVAATAELDHREGNGISVTLLWNREADTLTVRVSDEAACEQFELTAAPSEALDVFHHPFAYVATRPVRYLVPAALPEAA